ncbi:unnamed protein product [Acanthoscelides obtectus]|uniref:Uncharacterized protein n=1 Tax=Acanthoscelides obtectus TaxID=200917 RepID=A0A9P0PEC7_ACAOB|nr:unnamed protein product [Acanthoscelides obtectus]CAK1637720.1 hypothetical protein AOBTE_LOCUS10149 [Acanthoscelides obtectus]
MVKEHNRLKWSPNPPKKRPDNIISSKARERNIVAFKPQYEGEGRENMWKLMSNEDLREWFKEWAVFNKDVYTREQIIKEESKIQRKWIQRMMTYRQPTKLEIIEERLRKPISTGAKGSKIDIRCKYKPACAEPSISAGSAPLGVQQSKNKDHRHPETKSKDESKENEKKTAVKTAKNGGLRGNKPEVCKCNQKPLVRLCRCGISQ